MGTIIKILVWILCGFVCYKIAEKNGRNKTTAAIVGAIFGLFAILGYLIAGKKN